PRAWRQHSSRSGDAGQDGAGDTRHAARAGLVGAEGPMSVHSEEEARGIGVDAYVYLYPLVTMELSRRQMTNLAAGERPGFGPMGVFSHVREFPPADFKAVVRPNFDTLYSSAWLDPASE